MKHGMRTLFLLVVLGFFSEARRPQDERRTQVSTPGREKRSPFGYVVRGPNHVAAFQMGSLDDGLLGHFPKFTSDGFQRGGAFVANHLSEFFNNLVGPPLSRPPGKVQLNFQTPRPTSELPLFFNQGPVLGKKGAPVFPQGNRLAPRIETLPPPPLPALPPVNLVPSIRSPPTTSRQSTQYFVLGNTAPDVTNLYNHPSLPTANPVYPFSRTFHNYPTIVTLGHSNAGVLPTLNPSRAFPTLNPPFYTNNFATYAVSHIEPTRTFLQPTFAPLPPSPPLVPPLSPPSFSPVQPPRIPGPVTNFPNGTFFWFKLNNENFTFSPNYKEFMKSYQNPLFFTRPMQNSFFRPFFASGNRAFLYPSVNRVQTTNQIPGYVPKYFPGHFPLNIPFLKTEDEHPAEGHPGKHTTIYHGPAGGPSPTPTVKVSGAPRTSVSGTDPTVDADDPTSDPDSETTTSGIYPDTDTSPDADSDDDSVPSTTSDPDSEIENDERTESSTESSDSQAPDERKEPAYRGFVPATEAPRESPLPETSDDEDDQTKEPNATVIPFDTSTSADEDLASRPRSFDQSSDDGDQAEQETTTQDGSLNDDFDDSASVRRTGKSSRDSNDYDQLFVDFMTNPNSIDGAGKPESKITTTAKTELEDPPETTTAPSAETTTTEPPPDTTTVRFDEFDHFVDIFASEKPQQEETTTSATSETTITTSAPTTTEEEPQTTTTTTTPKPKFKLTTKFRTRLTSFKTTTPKPKIRTTIKFKLRTRVKITEPTTAKPTTTEAMTTVTEPPATTPESTTTSESSTTEMTTLASTTQSTTATVAPTTVEAVTEESSTMSVTEEATTFPAPLSTPEREELPTTTMDEQLASTTPDSTTMTTAADVTTELLTKGITTTDEPSSATTTQTSVSGGTAEIETVGSGDGVTTTTEASQTTDMEIQTSTMSLTAAGAGGSSNEAATEDSQTTMRSATDSPLSTPSEEDSAPGTTTPDADTTPSSDNGPDVTVENPTKAPPPEADSSLREKSENSGKGEEKRDEETTTAASSTESSAPEATEEPHPSNREGKKLEDENEETSSPGIGTSTTTEEGNTPTTTVSSTGESVTDTAPVASTTSVPEESTPATTGVQGDEATETVVPTEASTEAFETTTSIEEATTETVSKQPELVERRERVPETVLVGGRNYSDVQDNHPVVTGVETSEDNKKVRRAATWFVWFLDKEKIAKNIVNDVSNFATSRDIIYVVSAVLLISSMLSLMGLYCTLRSKK